MLNLFERKFSDCSIISNTSNPFQGENLAEGIATFQTEFIIEQQYFKKDILLKNSQNNEQQIICQKDIKLNELGEINLSELVTSLISEITIFQSADEFSFLYYDPISLVYHELGHYLELKEHNITPQILKDHPQIHIEVKMLDKEELLNLKKKQKKLQQEEKKSAQKNKKNLNIQDIDDSIDYKDFTRMTDIEMEMEFEFNEEEAKLLEQQLLQESILEQQILQAELQRTNSKASNQKLHSLNNNSIKSLKLNRQNSSTQQQSNIYDFVDNENNPNWSEIKIYGENEEHELIIFQYLIQQQKPSHKKIQKDKCKNNEVQRVYQSVQKWQKIIKQQKISPEKAAKKMNISVKILQNYKYELEQAEKIGFNLKNYMNQSLAYLRKQVRMQTTIKGRYQYSDIQNLIQNDQIIEDSDQDKQNKGKKSIKKVNSKNKKNDDSLDEDIFQESDETLSEINDKDLVDLLNEDLSSSPQIISQEYEAKQIEKQKEEIEQLFDSDNEEDSKQQPEEEGEEQQLENLEVEVEEDSEKLFENNDILLSSTKNSDNNNEKEEDDDEEQNLFQTNNLFGNENILQEENSNNTSMQDQEEQDKHNNISLQNEENSKNKENKKPHKTSLELFLANPSLFGHHQDLLEFKIKDKNQEDVDEIILNEEFNYLDGKMDKNHLEGLDNFESSSQNNLFEEFQEENLDNILPDQIDIDIIEDGNNINDEENTPLFDSSDNLEFEEAFPSSTQQQQTNNFAIAI